MNSLEFIRINYEEPIKNLNYQCDELLDYSFIPEMTEHYRGNPNCSYQFKRYGLKYLYEDPSKIELVKSIYLDIYKSVNWPLFYACYDNKGQKIKAEGSLKSNQIFKKITDEEGNYLDFNKMLLYLNHDLILCNREPLPKEIIIKDSLKPVKIYDIHSARRDIMPGGMNPIADYGYVHDGWDEYVTFDRNQVIFKRKGYVRDKRFSFDQHMDRLRDLLNNTDSVIEGARFDELTCTLLKEEGVDVDTIVKSKNYYLTEKNAIHLTQSLARYSLSPRSKNETLVNDELKTEEYEFMYFYLYNIYKKIGLYNWKPDDDMISYNCSSSPGYIYSRLFKENLDLEFFIQRYSYYIDKLLELDIAPTAIFDVFEKLCIQDKKKIGEIRTISHAPVHHSVEGKKFSHKIEQAYILNSHKVPMRMGQNLFNGNITDFSKFCEKDNNFIHRAEDLSKQDVHEHPKLMDIITQVRIDISSMNDHQIKKCVAFEEHNKNPFRITPFGEIRRSQANKTSGGSHTCLNNCDKHLMIKALETALILSDKFKIPFKRENFSTFWKMIESNNYVQLDVFSDDVLCHVHKSLRPYYLAKDNLSCIQQDLMRRSNLLLKVEKVEDWHDSIYVDSNGEGVTWLGNKLCKMGDKVYPVKDWNRIIYGLAVFNPESTVAKDIYERKDPTSLDYAYRLTKIFSYMLYLVPYEKEFRILERVRNKITSALRERWPQDKLEFEKLIAEGSEDRLLSLYITSRDLGQFGKTIDIWTYNDFTYFVGEKNIKRLDVNNIYMLNYFGKEFGYNTTEGISKVLKLLDLLGYHYKSDVNSTIMASDSPKNVMFTDKIYPFYGLDQVIPCDYVKNLSRSHHTTVLNEYAFDILIKQYLKRLNINHFNYANEEKKFTTIVKSPSDNIPLDKISLGANDRFFLVIPREGYIGYNLNRFVACYHNKIIEGTGFKGTEKDSILIYDVEDLFENYNLVSDSYLDKDWRIFELQKLNKESISIERFTMLPDVSDPSIIKFTNYGTDNIKESGEAFFGVDKQKNSYAFNKQMHILDNFYSQLESPFLNYIFGEEYLCKEDHKINSSDENQFIYYLNGGPGCGKTKRLIEIVELLSNKGKVAVCSLSNEHVANVALRMLGKLNFEYHFSKKALQSGQIPSEVQHMTKKADIKLSTMAMAWRNKILNQCDYLVLDEVSRICLAELVIFLQPFKFKRIFAFGDKYQANIYNPNADTSFWMRPITDYIPNSCTHYYHTTYRFGPKTVKMLNSIAYKEKPMQSYAAKEYIDKERIVFVNTCRDLLHEEKIYSQSDVNSFYNTKNSVYINNYLSKLTEEEKESVVIITPYTGQVVHYFNNGLKAYTIDSYQGREKNVVILDLVRCNPNTLGFIMDTTRLVVALSRHRYELRIYGCEYLVNKSILGQFIKSGLIVREI